VEVRCPFQDKYLILCYTHLLLRVQHAFRASLECNFMGFAHILCRPCRSIRCNHCIRHVFCKYSYTISRASHIGFIALPCVSCVTLRCVALPCVTLCYFWCLVLLCVTLRYLALLALPCVTWRYLALCFGPLS
jgi:hypothetical protein